MRKKFGYRLAEPLANVSKILENSWATSVKESKSLFAAGSTADCISKNLLHRNCHFEDIYNGIHINIPLRRCVMLALLDLLVAFDMIGGHMLLHKLQS